MYDLRRLQHLKHRLAVGALFALCLGAFQVAQAAKLPDFSRTGINYTGKSAQFGATGNGSTWGSTVPVSPPLGGGWQFAGNYGIPASATGPTMTMSGLGNVFFAGTKYPFQAGYQVPSSAVTDALKGMAGLAGGPLGLGLAIAGGAMPYVLDWLQRSGGRVNADGSIERQDPAVCTVAPCYEYSLSSYGSTWWSADRSSLAASYKTDFLAHNVGYQFEDISITTTGGSGYGVYYYRYRQNSGVAWTNWEAWFGRRDDSPNPPGWLPSSMDDIAPYMDPTTRDPRVISEILNKGGDIKLPAPTVTGPTSIDGPEKVTNNPDGSRTVEKTVYNFNTSGDTITNISNVTTTTIYNTDNSVQSSTTQTQTPTENDQKPADCEKDSSGLGCAKLLEPEQSDLPKVDRNVTYTPETWFGGGSCPADKFMTIGGQEVKVWDWVESCSLLVTYGRPLILAAAAFMALMILAPGVKT